MNSPFYSPLHPQQQQPRLSPPPQGRDGASSAPSHTHAYTSVDDADDATTVPRHAPMPLVEQRDGDSSTRTAAADAAARAHAAQVARDIARRQAAERAAAPDGGAAAPAQRIERAWPRSGDAGDGGASSRAHGGARAAEQCAHAHGSESPLALGGRLQAFAHEWRALEGVSIFARSVACDGVRVEWIERPRFAGLFNSRPMALSGGGASIDLTPHVADWLRDGVVERVPPAHVQSGFYSGIFGIPKKDGGVRLIFSAKRVNAFVVQRSFKMESIFDFIALQRPGDLVFKVDIAQAFHQVPVDKRDRPFLRFMWNGVAYQYCCLPMGLSSSPRTLTKVLKVAAKELRRQGVRAVFYVDDIAVLLTADEALRGGVPELVRTTLERFGWLINEAKSDLTPSTTIEFLGFAIDTEHGTIGLPAKKRQAARDVVKRALREVDKNQPRSTRKWAQLIGTLQAMRVVVPEAMLHTRWLMAARRSVWHRAQRQWDVRCALEDDSSLLRGCSEELRWWSALLRVTMEPRRMADISAFFDAPLATLTTDASAAGWGAHLHWGEGADPPAELEETALMRQRGAARNLAHGFWEAALRGASTASSNRRELTALLRGLRAFGDEIGLRAAHFAAEKGHLPVLLLQTDNTTAVANIRKQGGSSRPLTAIAAEIIEEARIVGVTLRIRHVPGVRMGVVDQLSRIERDRSDWRLDPAVFRQLCVLLSWEPSIDWFATSANAQVPRFVSRLQEEAATAVDAFTLPWSGERGYANPPFNLFAEILSKLVRDEATTLMVFPLWPSRPWWPTLTQQLCSPVILLPRRDDLFRPGHLHGEMGLGPPHFQVAAALVTGASERLAAWREQCSLHLEDADGTATKPQWIDLQGRPTTPP